MKIFIFLWASCICVWYIWNTVWYVLHHFIARVESFFSLLFFVVAWLIRCLFFAGELSLIFLVVSISLLAAAACANKNRKKNYNENIRRTLSRIQHASEVTIIHSNNNRNLWDEISVCAHIISRVLLCSGCSSYDFVTSDYLVIVVNERKKGGKRRRIKVFTRFLVKKSLWTAAACCSLFVPKTINSMPPYAVHPSVPICWCVEWICHYWDLSRLARFEFLKSEYTKMKWNIFFCFVSRRLRVDLIKIVVVFHPSNYWRDVTHESFNLTHWFGLFPFHFSHQLH